MNKGLVTNEDHNEAIEELTRRACDKMIGTHYEMPEYYIAFNEFISEAIKDGLLHYDQQRATPGIPNPNIILPSTIHDVELKITFFGEQ